MQKNLKKSLENGVKIGLQEAEEKVAKLFHETVKVHHELWSDHEDNNVTTVNDMSKVLRNKIARGDNGDDSLESGTSEGDDDEDTEDEAPSPDKDKPVLYAV